MKPVNVRLTKFLFWSTEKTGKKIQITNDPEVMSLDKILQLRYALSDVGEDFLLSMQVGEKTVFAFSTDEGLEEFHFVRLVDGQTDLIAL